MRGARLFQCPAMLCASLLLLIGNVAGQQGSPQSSTVQAPARSGSSSLRICLRLQDESPFSGPVNIRVLPSEGYEISGTSESEGEMLFSDVPPGTYTMETSAPGFLTVRQNIHIEAGHRLLTRFVIMKPRPFRVRVPEKSAALPSSVAAPGQTSWMPPGVDEAVPYVDPNVECPLPHILGGAGQRMKQFVSNLEKFTAAERVEHSVVDGAGVRHSPEVRNFDYVVMVSLTSTGVFLLDEYRNGSADPAQFPANIATEGMPAIALLFHPLLAPDFSFACEGLGQWEGHAAWQVHFVQRPDRPGRILSYSAGGKYSSLALKGRAWVDPGTFQVLRLESQLVQPLKEIALTEEHIAISYQPVKFRTLDQQLWLPQIAELYVERQGRRYYRRHTFSDFQLFTVETTQNIQLAKESYGFTNQSDRDITGVLTVTPISGARLDPVSVSFTIPAGGSVVKLVGPGKDVGIPVESVGTATFAHDGPQDAVRVDARLSKESTIDVISGASAPLKP
jgi:hypothetical protein